jgi:hypothetical protein
MITEIVNNMRYIISESQLDMIIPTPLKRRLDGLQELMYDVMMNNGMSLDADEYNDVEDFVNYVIDIMMYDIFPHTDYEEIPTYEKILIHLLGDKIREFWNENQS